MKRVVGDLRPITMLQRAWLNSFDVKGGSTKADFLKLSNEIMFKNADGS